MTITIVSLSAHGSDEICVCFSVSNGAEMQTERLLLSAAAVADLGLSVGACDEARFDAVFAASQMHEATKRGLAILSFGRCSPKMLVRKMMQKGIARDVATEAVKTLIRRGYLNPRADAVAVAENGVSKGWGRLRISSALREKGYSDAVVCYAMEQLDADGVDYVANCAMWIRRYGDIPNDPRERAKRYASLARYGYTASDIREALRIIEKE